MAYKLILILPLLAATSACGSKTTRAAKVQAASGLSAFFANNCTSCHGANGDEGFAPMLSLVAYADFVHSVRHGHPNLGVQAFDAADYPDAVLGRDFTALTGKPAHR